MLSSSFDVAIKIWLDYVDLRLWVLLPRSELRLSKIKKSLDLAKIHKKVQKFAILLIVNLRTTSIIRRNAAKF